MKFLVGLFMTVLISYFLIGACRIISMTFKTFCRSITIKNRRLAAMLIAYKNTWGIATSAEKRNKMSLPGLFAYIILFPEIVFLAYDCQVYITTDVTEFSGSAQKTYLAVVGWYYIIAVMLKIKEADKFRKGEIW